MQYLMLLIEDLHICYAQGARSCAILVHVMLSLDFICQHPQAVRDALRRRRDGQSIEAILRLGEQRQGLLTRSDGLYHSLKELKGAQSTAMSEAQPALQRQINAVTQDIRQLEIQITDITTRLQPLLLNLPNLPHPSVQEGESVSDDQEVERWGEALEFHFEPQLHWKLGERLGLFDAQSGAKVAGSRFVVLKGAGARLERALISFMLDVHTREHGYTEILAPQLLKRSAMLGAGQLPRSEDQAYTCTEDELYLNPTAEVALVGMQSDALFASSALPLCYVAWTTAFRREAGLAPRQWRGLLRLHQFNQVELFQLVTPQNSYAALEQMCTQIQTLLQRLELPYRVVQLCAKHLPFSAAKTFEVQVWMAGQERYIEVGSSSNCEDFQARRANIKYRPSQRGQAEYVHTLAATGLAVGRTMAAILETYQQADGSIIIPKVLRPYMGTALLVPPPSY